MRRSRCWIMNFGFWIVRRPASSLGILARPPEALSQISTIPQEKGGAKGPEQIFRQASLCAGLIVLAAVWLGPLPELARYAFSAHMLMHMSVVAVAAPLLAIGIGGGRLDLARKYPRLFAPIPASILELVIVWAWHAPVLHHAARHDFSAFMLEQAMFFGAGVSVWLSAVGGDPRSTAGRSAAGVVALLLTAMHITLLGALLGLSPRPLYTHMEGFSGLTALDDQHLGGAIMLLIGGVSYLFGGLWLTIRLLRSPREVPMERA